MEGFRSDRSQGRDAQSNNYHYDTSSSDSDMEGFPTDRNPGMDVPGTNYHYDTSRNEAGMDALFHRNHRRDVYCNNFHCRTGIRDDSPGRAMERRRYNK